MNLSFDLISKRFVKLIYLAVHDLVGITMLTMQPPDEAAGAPGKDQCDSGYVYSDEHRQIANTMAQISSLRYKSNPLRTVFRKRLTTLTMAATKKSVSAQCNSQKDWTGFSHLPGYLPRKFIF